MSSNSSLAHIVSQSLLTFLLTLVLIAFFLLLGASQITSEAPAQRILRRAVAVTTSLDARLPQLESGLHDADVMVARGAGDPVRLPDFPIPVDVPDEQAGTIAGDDLRALILGQAAGKLYEQGPSVWADTGDAGADQNIERVSTAGGLYHGFSLLTNDWHTAFVVATVISGGLALLLAVVLIINLPPYLRLIALSGVTLAASALSLAAAVGLRFALRTAETEADPFEEGLIDIGVDTLWIFIRNYLILSILALAVLAVAALAVWQQSRGAARSFEDSVPLS